MMMTFCVDVPSSYWYFRYTASDWSAVIDNGWLGTTLESWDLERCRTEALWNRKVRRSVPHGLNDTICVLKTGSVFILAYIRTWNHSLLKQSWRLLQTLWLQRPKIAFHAAIFLSLLNYGKEEFHNRHRYFYSGSYTAPCSLRSKTPACICGEIREIVLGVSC